jgi:hypothetical protein
MPRREFVNMLMITESGDFCLHSRKQIPFTTQLFIASTIQSIFLLFFVFALRLSSASLCSALRACHFVTATACCSLIYLSRFITLFYEIVIKIFLSHFFICFCFCPLSCAPGRRQQQLKEIGHPYMRRPAIIGSKLISC